MSKKHQPRTSSQSTQPMQAHHVATPRKIRKYRQCPCCYGGRGGVGQERWHKRINGTLMRYCFECDVCGFDWTVDVRQISEVVSIDHLEIDDIQTR